MVSSVEYQLDMREIQDLIAETKKSQCEDLAADSQRLIRIAYLYRKHGQLDKSLLYFASDFSLHGGDALLRSYERSVPYEFKTEYDMNCVESAIHMADLYCEKEDYDLALKYYHFVYWLSTGYERPIDQQQASTSIGNLYLDMNTHGDIPLRMENLGKAKTQYFASLQLLTSLFDVDHLYADLYLNVGIALCCLGQFDESLDYLQKSEEYSTDPQRLCRVCLNRLDWYRDQHRIADAMSFCDPQLDYFTSVEEYGHVVELQLRLVDLLLLDPEQSIDAISTRLEAIKDLVRTHRNALYHYNDDINERWTTFRHLQKVIRKIPDVDLLIQAKYYLDDLNSPEKAIRIFEIFSSSDRNVLYAYGWAHERIYDRVKGASQNGAPDLRRAVDLYKQSLNSIKATDSVFDSVPDEEIRIRIGICYVELYLQCGPFEAPIFLDYICEYLPEETAITDLQAELYCMWISKAHKERDLPTLASYRQRLKQLYRRSETEVKVNYIASRERAPKTVDLFFRQNGLMKPKRKNNDVILKMNARKSREPCKERCDDPGRRPKPRLRPDEPKENSLANASIGSVRSKRRIESQPIEFDMTEAAPILDLTTTKSITVQIGRERRLVLPSSSDTYRRVLESLSICSAVDIFSSTDLARLCLDDKATDDVLIIPRDEAVPASSHVSEKPDLCSLYKQFCVQGSEPINSKVVSRLEQPRTDPDMAPLKLPVVGSLTSLCFCQIQDATSILKLPVAHLDLSWNNISAAPGSVSCVSLNLAHNQFASFSLFSTSLRHLNLAYNGLASLDLAALSAWNLKTLILDGNPISAIRGLFPSLATLSMRYHLLDAMSIVELVSDRASLQYLDLTTYRPCSSDEQQRCEALFPHIHELRL